MASFGVAERFTTKLKTIKGMKEMRDNGIHTIGQNEETCVVYGMPQRAKEAGGVITEIGLGDIPNAICESLKS